MGGGGPGVRFKPTRYFGIETRPRLRGRHATTRATSRNETAFTFNGLFFLNPRSRAQMYLLGGLRLVERARHRTTVCVNGSCDPSALDAHYGYFGGQAGIGLELRLDRDARLQRRPSRLRPRREPTGWRQSQPEFTNADGRTTNTSGGGLITGGVTLYF